MVAQSVRGLGEEPEGLQIQINGKERCSRQGASPVVKIRSLDGKGAFMKYNVCFIYLYLSIHVLGFLISSGMGRIGKKHISKPLELNCDSWCASPEWIS